MGLPSRLLSHQVFPLFVCLAIVLTVSFMLGCGTVSRDEEPPQARLDSDLSGIDFYLFGYFPETRSPSKYEAHVSPGTIEMRGGRVADVLTDDVDCVVLGLCPGTFDIYEYSNYLSDISTREVQLKEYANTWGGLMLEAEERKMIVISAYEFNRRIGHLDNVGNADWVLTGVWDDDLKSVGRARDLSNEN